MAPLPTYGDRPAVLLTNDDGPPGPASPNIYGFAKLLQQRLGWDVKVVIPDCQKSWAGKAYAIKEVVSAQFFYPRGPDGLTGDICSSPRPLQDGEDMEWVLITGTPATCTNIALHNLYPGEIDLVISGPNHGRNSSTAFALSSGTIGAALAAVMSVPIPGPSGGKSLHQTRMPAIAMSYGVVTRPVPESLTNAAHEVAVDICQRLWNDWGYERFSDGHREPIQLFTVNVPLVEEHLRPEKRQACWTNMWRNSYGRLFKQTEEEKADYDPVVDQPKPGEVAKETSDAAGPGAMPDPATPSSSSAASPITTRLKGPIKFKFAPDIAPLLAPMIDTLPVGSDAWGFAKGYVTITPMRAEHSVIGDTRGVCVGEEGEVRSPGTLWKRTPDGKL